MSHTQPPRGGGAFCMLWLLVSHGHSLFAAAVTMNRGAGGGPSIYIFAIAEKGPCCTAPLSLLL
jgi:hypothetical protein